MSKRVVTVAVDLELLLGEYLPDTAHSAHTHAQHSQHCGPRPLPRYIICLVTTYFYTHTLLAVIVYLLPRDPPSVRPACAAYYVYVYV